MENLKNRKSYKFIIGSPEVGYSSKWVAFANKSEFYFNVRVMGGRYKVSLHSPRPGHPYHVGRVAFIPDYFEANRQLLSQARRRMIREWRLDEPPLEGAICAAVILFPTNYLSIGELISDLGTRPNILRPAQSDQALSVEFYWSREPIDTLVGKLSLLGDPLATTKLENGSVMMILKRSVLIKPDDIISTLLNKNRMKRILRKMERETYEGNLKATVIDTAGIGGIGRMIDVDVRKLVMQLDPKFYNKPDWEVGDTWKL